MKKVFKIIICLVLTFILVGCVSKEEKKFIGVFLTKYTVKGDQYYEYLEIKKDGTYASHKFRLGDYISTKKGDYEIPTADTIVLYKDKNHNSWTELTYRAGKLLSRTLYYEKYEDEIPERNK